MRVLFIGHTYIVKTNRQKLYELAKMPEIELFLVIPQSWPHPLFRFKHKAEIEGDEPFHIFALKAVFEGRERRYFYINLGRIFKKVRPDIIQVEQGANAVSYFQALMLRNLLVPRAKALFFTWMNILYHNSIFFSLIEKFNLRNSTGAICGNKDAENILMQKGFNRPVKILPQLGVDINLYRKIDVAGLKKKLRLNSFVIGYVGRFVKAKGILLLLRAAAKIKENWQILLIGKGGLKEEIIKLSKQLGIEERIIFVDVVPHREIPRYLNCMDTMVLPSLTTPFYDPCFKEQFGHVLVEAMSCEVPVIGSSSAEIPNVIGDAGLIFKEGDVDDLYRKLLVIMNDKEFREELAKKGKQRIFERYTHREIAEETYKFYKKLLG